MRIFIKRHYERLFSGMRAFYLLLGLLVSMFVLLEYVVPPGSGGTFRHGLAFSFLTAYSLLATAIIFNIIRAVFLLLLTRLHSFGVPHVTRKSVSWPSKEYGHGQPVRQHGSVDVSAPTFEDISAWDPLMAEGMYHGDFMVVGGTLYDTSDD